MGDFKQTVKELFDGCLTIPNALSLLRIILIPVFATLFIKEYYISAVIVMIVAALTDLIDGKVARKFNMVSNLGKILDPIADKLSQIAIVIVLIVKYYDSAIKYLLFFFIAKELLMIIGGVVLLSKGLKPTAAEMWGKVATTVFYIAMILIIALGDCGALVGVLHFTLPNWLTWGLVIVSAICTLCALLGYVPGFVKQLKEKNLENKG